MNETPTGKMLIAIFLILIAIGVVFFIGSSQSGEGISLPKLPGLTSSPEQGHTATDAEYDYVVAMAQHVQKITDAANNLSSVISSPQIGDATWRATATAQLLKTRILCDQAIMITPPNSMINIHNKYLQAMNNYKAAVELILQGVNYQNTELVNQAKTQMETGKQLVSEVIKEINEFTGAQPK
ncbi:hypothetical protein ACFLYL_01040 [Chloroflexota bacterium]